MINWKNKGMLLEEIINFSIQEINKNDQGIFHKLDVPVSFGKVQKEGNALVVEKAYISKKSTTDYYGTYKGKYIVFEAKSTIGDVLPFSNIHAHQWDYVQRVLRHGGIAFFIIGFMRLNEFYIIDTSVLQNLSTKSIKIEDARKYGFKLELIYPGKLNILSYIENELKK